MADRIARHPAGIDEAVSGNGFSTWVVEWPSFFSEPNAPAANKARKIDTRVAFSMGHLPAANGALADSLFTVLSARNLIRSMALQVPTGQAVAAAMGITPLTNDELLRSPYTNPTPEQQRQHQTTIDVLQAADGLLLRQTPLWYYILKEAEVIQDGNQLGLVGGRIVTEVFIRILVNSQDSILQAVDPQTNALTAIDWLPKFGFNTANLAEFKITDLLRFAGNFSPSAIR